MPSRRSTLGALATPLLAGCVSDGQLVGRDPARTTLGAVGIQSLDSDPHEVAFRVEWDGDVVHDQTYEIEGFDEADDQLPGETPERTWPDEPGEFTVSAQLAGEEWQTTEPGNWDHPECMGVTAEIGSDGVLVLKTATNPYECTDEATEAGTTEDD